MSSRALTASEVLDFLSNGGREQLEARRKELLAELVQINSLLRIRAHVGTNAERVLAACRGRWVRPGEISMETCISTTQVCRALAKHQRAGRVERDGMTYRAVETGSGEAK